MRPALRNLDQVFRWQRERIARNLAPTKRRVTAMVGEGSEEEVLTELSDEDPNYNVIVRR